MLRSKNPRRMHAGRTIIAVLVYLSGFLLLVMLISHFYLLPATKVFGQADSRSRESLAADATLIMTVVLFLLFVGLLFTFGVGRFFRVRQTKPSKPTKYTDAWEESGRRLKTPDPEE